MRVALWITHQYAEDEAIKQQVQKMPVWARPFGCLTVVGFLGLVFILIAQVIELVQLWPK